MNDFLRKIRKAAQIMRMPSARAALLSHRVAATTEHDAVLRSARLDVVIDVGANRGQFALAVRSYHPHAKIIAFEPLRAPASTFRRLFAGDSRTVLHECAVAATTGRADMHVSKRDDSSSLMPISRELPTIFSGTEDVGIEKVSVAPLTQFVDSDDLVGEALLKIDVQGLELQVLESATPVLREFQRIYVEGSFLPLYDGQPLAHEVIAFLCEYDFRLAGVFNASYHPRSGLCVQADFLFAH